MVIVVSFALGASYGLAISGAFGVSKGIAITSARFCSAVSGTLAF